MMAFFLFLLLIHQTTLPQAQSIVSEQAQALLDLKTTLNTSLLSDWDHSNTHIFCSWTGITCNSSTVTAIHLGQLGLTGTIPATPLIRLPDLQTLNLSYNHLTGPLDPRIATLTNLKTIILTSNSLSGHLPSVWSSSIQYLDFAHNNLTGPVPEICVSSGESQLRHLVVSENRLTGLLPESFALCPNLESLQFCFNRLHGQIPASLNNSTSLRKLTLDWNDFHGKVFAAFPELVSRLSTLELVGNRFSGELPSGHSNLMIVGLRHNSFTGGIPEAICSWRKLLLLSLGFNSLTGPIPSCINNIKTLQVLDLSSNRLTGSLPQGLEQLTGFRSTENNQLWKYDPSELVAVGVANSKALINYRRLLHDLKVFDVSNNSLRGALPTGLGELAGIRMLDLSHNFFEGVIPPELGGISKLLLLDMSHNNLHGGIPARIARLELSSFSVAYNNLSGVIPSENVFNTRFDAESFVGNPGLHGCPLTSPCFSARSSIAPDEPPGDIDGDDHRSGCFSFVAFYLSSSAAFIVALYLTLYCLRGQKEEEAHLRDNSRVHPFQWLSSDALSRYLLPRSAR